MKNKRSSKKSKSNNISHLVKNALNKARNNLHDEASEILSKQGGSYIPDFGYNQHIDYNESEKLGWDGISKFLSNVKIDERVNNYIKSRKGEEEVLQHILNSPHKDILLQNPNIMKCFILEKSVFPRLKNKVSRKTTKYYKRGTQEAMASFLNRGSGVQNVINEIKARHNKVKPKVNSTRKNHSKLGKKIARKRRYISPDAIRANFSPIVSPLGSPVQSKYDSSFSSTMNTLLPKKAGKRHRDNRPSAFSTIPELKHPAIDRVFSPPAVEGVSRLISNDSSGISQNLSTNESFQQMRNQLKEMSIALESNRKGNLNEIKHSFERKCIKGLKHFLCRWVQETPEVKQQEEDIS